MGHHDEGSGQESSRSCGGEHVDVDVIGGLVKNQNIGFFEQGQHQLQSAALAA